VRDEDVAGSEARRGRDDDDADDADVALTFWTDCDSRLAVFCCCSDAELLLSVFSCYKVSQIH